MADNAEQINAFIDAVREQDFSSANTAFDDLMGDKIGDALEQQRVNVAGAMFGATEEASEEE